MQFRFRSSDLFLEPEHLFIGLRANFNLNYQNVSQSSWHGAGVIIGRMDVCGISARTVAVEVWRSHPAANRVVACANITLQHNRNYDFSIRTTDAGFLYLTVRDVTTNATIVNSNVDLVPLFAQMGTSYPATSTGYFVMQGSERNLYDYTAYLTNFSVTWQ